MFLKGNQAHQLWGRSSYRKIVIIVVLLLILVFLRTLVTRKLLLNIISKSETLKNEYLRWNNLNESERYLCPVMTGRLGNQMFIFGTSYLLAKKANMKLLISHEGELMYDTFKDIFEDENIIYRDTKNICRVFRKHQKKTHQQVVDTNILNFLLVQESSVLLFSYFQSYKNFENHENEVRTLFRFNDSVRRLVYTELLDARLSFYPNNTFKEVTYVGVHIRRGDILSSKRGFNAATQNYLRKAINYFKKKFRNTLFIVRSNGVGWTEHTIKLLQRKLPNLRIIMPIKYDSTVDLAMLASCNHSIITVGTFSWWAGWLTGGKVVYYKKAALPGSKHEAFLSEGTYYPPEWIGIA